MKLSLYSFYEHRDIVAKLLLKREKDQSMSDELPTLGYVAFDDDMVPVAAAFLRFVEGGSGMIDSLVTNPACSSKMRHHCIDAVIRELIARAKEMGLRRLIAFSIDAGTLERSKSYGFEHLPHTVIGLDLP